MNKIDLFNTRIIIGDKVYLLAKDVREAYVEAMIELEEVHRKEKHGNKG